MKIYERKPETLIRVNILRQGAKTEHIALTETTLDSVVYYITAMLTQKNGASVIVSGRKTTVNIREAIDGKNGRSKSCSFYGMSPSELLELIKQDLKTDAE